MPTTRRGVQNTRRKRRRPFKLTKLACRYHGRGNRCYNFGCSCFDCKEYLIQQSYLRSGYYIPKKEGGKNTNGKNNATETNDYPVQIVRSSRTETV